MISVRTLATSVVITLAFIFATAATAAPPCKTEESAALSAIYGAHLGQGLQQKLVTKIDDGWREYYMGQQAQAVKDVQGALDLLDSSATKQIPPVLKTSIRTAISNFLACITATVPPATGKLTVRTFVYDETTNSATTSAGSGVTILVEDIEIGTTAADGTVTAKVPAGSLTVVAQRGSTEWGSAQVDLGAGGSATVNVALLPGKEVSNHGGLTSPQITDDGILPQNFQTLSFQLTNDGQTIPVSSVALATISAPGDTRWLQDAFGAASDGTVSLNHADALRAALDDRTDPFTLRFHLLDRNGRSYFKSVDFVVGRYALSGTVTAPPSAPALSLSGLFVTATHASTGFTFRTTTDARGAFRFDQLPEGGYLVKTDTANGSKTYNGSGAVVLKADGSVTVPLIGADDIVQGVLHPAVAAHFASAPSTTAAVTGTQQYRVRSLLFEYGVGELIRLHNQFEERRSEPLKPASEEALQSAIEAMRTSGDDVDAIEIAVTAYDIAGNVIHRTVSNVSLKEFMDSFDAEGELHPHRTRFGTRMPFIVRVPLETTRVHLQRGGREYDFDLLEAARRLQSATPAYTPAPCGTPLNYVSDPAPNDPNGIDVAIVGDGYQDTTAGRQAFFGAVNQFISGFQNKTPYKEYFNNFHFRIHFVPSCESGAIVPRFDAACASADCCKDPDAPAVGRYPNNAFGSRYCTNQLALRIVGSDYTAVANRLMMDQVPFDIVLVAVNENIYGGSAVFSGFATIGIVSGGSVPDTAAHEFGHAFTNLADEYVETASEANSGSCSDGGGPTPCEPNVTDISNLTQVKWQPWVGQQGVNSTVGAYQGARYSNDKYYRPETSCAMNLGGPFCAICRQEFIRRLYRGGWGGSVSVIVPLSARPLSSEVDIQPGVAQAFSIGIKSPVQWTHYEWFVDGVPQHNDSASFTWTASNIGAHRVTVSVSDNTPYVKDRVPQMDGGYTWNVRVMYQISTGVAYTSADQDVAIGGATQFGIPANVKTVHLHYHVSTTEFSGRCNGCFDEWKVSVVGVSGNTTSVNAGDVITGPPDVDGDATITIDPALVPTGTQLILSAFVTNHGDANNPTTIVASLQFDPPTDPCSVPGAVCPTANIVSVTAEPMTAAETSGDSSYYSMPRSGQTNTYQRNMDVVMKASPANATVRLKVDAIDPDTGGVFQTVYDNPVTASLSPQLPVTVTMTIPSTLPATPATHKVRYRFTESVSANGVTNTTTYAVDTISAGDPPGTTVRERQVHALWAIPDEIARYGVRETGGDGWGSRGLFRWMTANSFALAPVDDVSGEHARKIGAETSHQYGTDFNMFYPVKLVTAYDETANYTRLRADADYFYKNFPFPAIGSTQGAELASFIFRTRKSIDAMVNAGGVETVVLGTGEPCGTPSPTSASQLPLDWMYQALAKGRITVPGQGDEVIYPPWDTATNPHVLAWDCANDSHVTVKLSRCAVDGETCGGRRHAARSTITSNPTPGVITAGESYTMAVGASGDGPLNYQWYQGASGDSSNPVAGATSSTVTVQPATTTSYWVSVSNYEGAANSAAAQVTVLAACTPLAVTAQPQSQTITAGSAATLSVDSSGSEIKRYIWFEGALGDTTRPVGYSSSTILVAPDRTTQYWVSITNSCSQVRSDAATITVNAPCAAPSIVAQPASTTVNAGQPFTLGVTASGTSLTYQWFSGPAAAGPWSTISGATAAALTMTPSATAFYFVHVTGQCGTADSVPVSVTVTPLCTAPVINAQPISQAILQGGSVTLSVSGTGTSLQYQWYTGTSGDTSAPIPGATSASMTVTPAATTRYWARLSNACGTADSVTADIVVNPACSVPSITSQPQDSSITSGQTATVSVSASGSGLSYQWYVGLSGTATQPISGAVNSSLTLSPTATTQLWVRVTNACGGTNSTTATITVTPACVPPSILQQPGSVTIVAGTSASLSVVAGGSSVSYQWYAGSSGDTTSPVPGGTSNALSIAPASTTSFWVAVRNACGTQNSNAATVTVTPVCNPASITTNPQNVTSGGPNLPVTLSVTATGTSLTYQWFVSEPVGAPFVVIAGASGPSISVSPDATAQYFARVSSPCGTVDSSVATVTVPPCVAPSITQQPQDTTYPAGGTATFSVAASGTNLTYQWFASDPAGSASSSISGATAATLTIAPASPTATYFCRVTDRCGTSIDSQVATATETVCEPVFIQQPQSQSSTNPGNQSIFLAVSAQSDTPVTYQWYSSADGINFSPIAAATDSSITVTPSVTTYYYCLATNGCGSSQSNYAVVTVCYPPVITSQPPASQTVAQGSSVTLSVAAYSPAGDALRYQWYVGLFDPQALIGETSSSLTFTVSTPGSAVYSVRVTNNCTDTWSNTAEVITANP